MFALLPALSVLAASQEPPKAEIFGGYQYFHASSGVSGADSFNLNGWNAALSGYFNRYLGITSDFAGVYGTPTAVGVGVHTHFYSFLFGPVVRVANGSKLTPFAHALFGGGHLSLSALGASSSETDFTWAAGGGADWNLTRNFSVRLAQADFMQIHTSGSSQNAFRYSAGIVLKF
jgi:opacity protein-like surface antigen